jgi:CBS-domain-containing membrane protein
LARHQVRRLPVIDARDRLVGVLSLDDLAREACDEADLIQPQVSADEVGRTLGQIARPHLVLEASSGTRASRACAAAARMAPRVHPWSGRFA